MKTLCKHCHLEIKQIVDPWGFHSFKGFEYPWYHVEASENADGEYITECPDDSGEEAEPEVICDKCEERPATHEGRELINSEMGFKQYGTIMLCDKCDPGERDSQWDTLEEMRGEV